MTPSVNLLPWRHSVRQRRQRCRISAIVSVIALLISGFSGGGVLLQRQIAVVQKQGGVLENQHRKLQEILYQQQGEPLQGEQQYRGREQQHRVLRWETILTDLANKLPENSWLRSVGWQSSMLTLEGYTSEIEDLEKIETLLKQLPGVFHIKAGPVSYQGEQGLAYTFIMEEAGGVLVPP